MGKQEIAALRDTLARTAAEHAEQVETKASAQSVDRFLETFKQEKQEISDQVSAHQEQTQLKTDLLKTQVLALQLKLEQFQKNADGNITPQILQESLAAFRGEIEQKISAVPMQKDLVEEPSGIVSNGMETATMQDLQSMADSLRQDTEHRLSSLVELTSVKAELSAIKADVARFQSVDAE